MKNYVIFNDLHSYEDLGLLLDAPSIPALNEDVEEVEVDGRNGALTIKKGTYRDRVIPLSFTVIRKFYEDTESFISRVDNAINWLDDVNNTNLITYLRPNKKYIVKRVVKDVVEIENSKMITINTEFICEPFMYELDETVLTITEESTIYNQGHFNSECNIKIYGTGNIQLTINSDTVQINNVNEYVELDSKFLLCLNKDKTSKSRDMIGHFPLLIRGFNTVSWEGNVSKVEILPRTAYR